MPLIRLAEAIDGKRISDYVAFTQYLDIAIRSTSMRFRFGTSTRELGAFGYVVALLQVVGFAAGGFGLFAYLVSKPYCEKCSRYLTGEGKQVRYTGDAEGLQATTAQVFERMRAGTIAAAIQEQGAFGTPGPQKNDHLRSVFQVRYCKQCGKHWVQFSIEKQSGDSWDEISEMTVGGFTDEVVSVAPSRSHADSSTNPVTRASETTSRVMVPAPAPVTDVVIRCWQCKEALPLSDETRGKSIQCPKCGTKQKLPS